MKMSLAPIVLFVYNRPNHTKRLLESLRRNNLIEHSKLFVYCDGPKLNSSSSDIANIILVRDLVKKINFCKEVEIIESGVNKGLANSVISGVNQILRSYNNVIVLEDDLELSDNFLNYMNYSLCKYESYNQVYQISGHTFNLSSLNKNSAMFLPFTTSWGWGTWKRAWDKFEINSNDWGTLFTDNSLRNDFNLKGTYKYDKMLKSQIEGSIDSWAIRWYWTVFINKGLVLFPPYTLVNNLGFDGSGTHGKGFFRYFKKSQDSNDFGEIIYPSEACIVEEDFNNVKRAIFKANGGYIGRFVDFFKGLFIFVIFFSLI